jgi:hypothetical protein
MSHWVGPNIPCLSISIKVFWVPFALLFQSFGFRWTVPSPWRQWQGAAVLTGGGAFNSWFPTSISCLLNKIRVFNINNSYFINLVER